MVDILAVGNGAGLDEKVSWYRREELVFGGVDETSCRMVWSLSFTFTI